MKYLLMATLAIVILYFDIYNWPWCPYDLPKVLALYGLSGLLLILWFVIKIRENSFN